MSSKPIRFLLNDEELSLEGVNPNTTLLQYLRAKRGKTGTKEGCASGDCGACTVVLASPSKSGQLEYKSVNSCITLLPSVHAKHVISVEGLASDAGLHAVQDSMVKHHGSQCGLCTPGFIMSMFALSKKHPSPSREQTLEALSGNLCRCTGYRSIVDAAVKLETQSDHFDLKSNECLTKLNAIVQDSTESIELSADGCRAFAPKSIDELSDLIAAHPDAKLVAGGTDLSLQITQNLHQFDTLISTSHVAELVEIENTDAGLRIGSAASYSEFSHLIATLYPEWGAMIERLGSQQVRNLGTLGGNIANASPIGDMPPVLIAVGASLCLRLGSNTREIAAQDFFVDYKVTALQQGEFIESIFIPKHASSLKLKVYKVSKRFDDDISAVLAAIALQIDDGLVSQARIAFGGMAATPKRALHCESALINQSWSSEVVEQAAAQLENDFTPLSDARASSSYRLSLAKNLLQRAYIEISEPETLTQVNASSARSSIHDLDKSSSSKDSSNA